MLRHFVLSPKTINRLAVMGILPMMVLSILAGRTSGGASSSEPPELPREGTLVIANLRSEALTIHDLGGNGEPHTLALQGAPHELVATADRVYATIPPEETIVEIDPKAPGVLRSMAAGPMVHGLALEDSDTLVATVDGAKSVLTIDRTTLTTTSTNATGDTPHTVAVLDGAYYITDSRDGALRRIDTATRATTTVSAGVLPESVTIAGERIAIADAASGQISWFSPDLELLGRITVGGTPVRVITLDEERIIVSLNSDTHIAVLNLRTGEIERRIKVAGHPDGLCLSPYGRFLAIASNQYDSVSVFRTTDWKLMVTLEAGDGPGSCVWL